MTILITIMKKNGKGKTRVFGTTPMRTLVAAIGTAAATIDKVNEQTGLTKEALRKTFENELSRLTSGKE